MPKIYEYIGITILFFSDEHDPIHIHCIYGGAILKVSFFVSNGKITRTTYKKVAGSFPSSKLKKLKTFISEYKYQIVQRWIEYFIEHKNVECKRITKQLR